MDDNSGFALSTKGGRPSVKTGHVGARISVFEEFAIDCNLNADILI